MADQPSPTSPNASRITSMLQDLSAVRSASAPTSSMPIPPNLPTRQPMPSAPAPAPMAPPPVPRDTQPLRSTPPPPSAMPAPKAPEEPMQSPAYTGTMRSMQADISNMQVGRAPESVAVPAPVVTPAPTPLAPNPVPPAPAPIISVPAPVQTTTPSPAIITIPEDTGSGSRRISRVLLSAILGVAAIIGIVLVVQLFTGGTTDTPIVSATPSTSPAISGAKTLREIFHQSAHPIALKKGSTIGTELRAELIKVPLTAKQAVPLTLSLDGILPSLPGFLEAVGMPVPTALQSALGNEWTMLSYGQSEQFTPTGAIDASAATQQRLIIVSQLKDATAGNQGLAAWESANIATASQQLFGHRVQDASVPTFSTGSYRQIPVQYWNFPYADHSLDAAVVLSSNGNTYLVIASSRESAFFAIDQLTQ